MTVTRRLVDSPLGPIALTAEHGAVTGLHLDAAPGDGGGGEDEADADLLAEAAAQLAGYLSGERTDFDLPVRLAGTPFQVAVWEALREIPYGRTWTYGELARRIGRPTASRAVGAANGRNPVSIIVPCHRVIGGDRSLTGYAWGPQRKQWLLDLERRDTLEGVPSRRIG